MNRDKSKRISELGYSGLCNVKVWVDLADNFIGSDILEAGQEYLILALDLLRNTDPNTRETEEFRQVVDRYNEQVGVIAKKGFEATLFINI